LETIVVKQINIQSPFDPEPQDEADLWFLPGPPEDAAWDLPGPQAPPAPALPKAPVWAAVEGRTGRALAEAAAAVARLDERVAALPGAASRLALDEASGLQWITGAGVAVDRLALYDVLRLTRMADAHRDFAAAHWACRRLKGGVGPLGTDLGAFLGRHGTGEDGLGDLSPRPTGAVFAGLAADWQAAVRAGDLHPLTRGAVAFFGWRALMLSGPEGALEAAVAAARVGAGGLRALPFVPLAVAGRGLWRVGGTEAERLLAWLRAVETAAVHARLMLDRLSAWEDRARAGTAALSGRTPGRLIAALLATPVLSVGMAARLTGASQATALRTIARFEAQGLVREITGQGRFRVWAAAA
jgi:hypothetical protein